MSSNAKIRLGPLGWIRRGGKVNRKNDPPHSPMTTTSPFAPSYAIAENPLTPKVDISAGPNSHFFQPPLSASSSLQSSTISVGSSAFDSRDIRSRKRARNESSFGSMSSNSACPTPPPLMEVRYKLAPERSKIAITSARPRQTLSVTSAEQHGPRRGRGDGAFADLYNGFPSPTAQQGTEGEAQVLPNSPSIRDGLGNVIHRFATVAGKAWQNWSTAFRGFYAGGGQEYEINRPTEPNGGQGRWQVIRRNEHWQKDEGIPATPGGFPQDDFIPDYMAQDHTQTPSRAAKRTRRNSGSPEKWVLVGETTLKGTCPSTVLQKNVPQQSSGLSRRRDLRAPVRKSVPTPSRSSIAGSPRLIPDRASFASPRAPLATSSPKRDSPVSIEVRRHAARIRRKEAEEEAAMKRFNQQIKAMIRQGNEALGTKVEVELDVNDEIDTSGDIF